MVGCRPIGPAYVEPCWRQHYPRLVLGLGPINAITADSSQLTASDADGVRPELGRSAAVRSLCGCHRSPQPAKTPPTDRAAVASPCLSRWPARRESLGAWDRPEDACMSVSARSAMSFSKTDEQVVGATHSSSSTTGARAGARTPRAIRSPPRTSPPGKSATLSYMASSAGRYLGRKDRLSVFVAASPGSEPAEGSRPRAHSPVASRRIKRSGLHRSRRTRLPVTIHRSGPALRRVGPARRTMGWRWARLLWQQRPVPRALWCLLLELG
jgi:hypothetical protein